MCLPLLIYHLHLISKLIHLAFKFGLEDRPYIFTTLNNVFVVVIYSLVLALITGIQTLREKENLIRMSFWLTIILTSWYWFLILTNAIGITLIQY